MAKVKVGDLIGSVALKNMFDAHAPSVLGDYLSRVEKHKKGSRTQYKVKLPLPSTQEYNKLREQKYTVSAGSLVEDACCEIESLGEEMVEWYDNLPESFQSSDKGDRIQEAADNLQNADRPDIPNILQHINLVYLPALKIQSRQDRLDEAVSMLRAAAEAVDEWVENNRTDENQQKGSIEIENQKIEFDWDDVLDISTQIENMVENVESTEFPSMYG